MPLLSIIVPVCNEAAGLAAALTALSPLRGAGTELIVVDGDSDDGSAELAMPLCDRLVRASRGRALQMNAGAASATGQLLLFLHVDTVLPNGAIAAIVDGLAESGWQWGRFDVRLSGERPALRVVEQMMNLRSRLSGIATGDQAMFMTREAFDAAGGFPAIPLMEDIAISRLLKRQSRPLCLRERVVTSSRRWERDGVWRTIVLMWRLRLAYFLGADPADLVRRYY